MSQWSSAKAKRVLAALLHIGWRIKRESSSHKVLSRPEWSDVVFAFHDKDEIGPKDAGSYRQAYWSKARGFVIGIAIDAASPVYWQHVKPNGQPVEDKTGTYTAPRWVWDDADKKKKTIIDACYKKYR